MLNNKQQIWYCYNPKIQLFESWPKKPKALFVLWLALQLTQDAHFAVFLTRLNQKTSFIPGFRFWSFRKLTIQVSSQFRCYMNPRLEVSYSCLNHFSWPAWIAMFDLSDSAKTLQDSKTVHLQMFIASRSSHRNILKTSGLQPACYIQNTKAWLDHWLPLPVQMIHFQKLPKCPWNDMI